MAFSRRYFFYGTLLAGAIPSGGFGSTVSLKAAGYRSPNEKVNFAAIGAGGQGFSNLRAAAPTENVVALCDVDDRRATPTFKAYPKAPTYRDFRKMLDQEGRNIDAVIVASPDHMHATHAMWCMERGKHVYVQKPLVRTVWEARQMRAAAAKYKVATQMGNQGYSNEGTRQAAEIIWSGEIGGIKEVHAWTNRPLWPQGLTEIPAPDAVPPTLDWDLWLGIAADRPFTAGGKTEPDRWDGFFYQPFNWRGFYDFGCGALGDMACHILGAPNLALHLSQRKLLAVECLKKKGVSSFMFPKASTIRFDFAAYGDMPALSVFWYDGLTESPKIAGVPEGEWIGDAPTLQPAGAPAPARPAASGFQTSGRVFNAEQFETLRAPDAKLRIPSPNGSLFIGEKGLLTTGTYGEVTRLLPYERMREYKMPPPLLTRSPGHMRDFIRACKGGDPACSNFEVASPFVEWMLLGVIALRHEGKLEYDPARMKITNNPEANRLLKPAFRKGWKFHSVKI